MKTVLIIFLCIIAAVLLIISLPVFLKQSFDEKQSIIIKVLFIPFVLMPEEDRRNPKGRVQRLLMRLFGKKKKPKKAGSEIKKKSAEKPPSKEEGSALRGILGERGISGVIELFGNIVKLAGGTFEKCLRGISILRCDIDIAVGGEDAAQTAISYGRWCALFYPGISLVFSKVRRYKKNIRLYPEFGAEDTKVKTDTLFMLFPIIILTHLTAAFLRMIFSEIKRAVEERIKDSKKINEGGAVKNG